MQCAEFETQLQSTLDRRTAPESDGQLVEHAEHCNACRQVLDTARLLQEGLKIQFPAPRSPHLGHQVLDRLAAEKSKRTSRRRFALAIAIAAALLIAILPFARGPRDDTAKVKSAPRPHGLAIATVGRQPQPSPTMSAEEAEEFRLLIRHLLDQVSIRQLEGFESVDQVAGKSIRPLAVTFQFALDTLRRTLPGQGSAETNPPQARTLPRAPMKAII